MSDLVALITIEANALTSYAMHFPTAPRRRDRQATEAAFIAAATEIFAERGFEATTTKAVARQAGYSEALIQLYFGGKEGLLLAVIQNEGGGEHELIEFEARPLAADLESEALETLDFIIDMLVRRASGLRIVLARVLVDARFKDGFNYATVRKTAKRAVILRLERHRELGRLSPDADSAASAELLISLAFQLGFIHGEILDGDVADRDRLAASFAALFGRATSNR